MWNALYWRLARWMSEATEWKSERSSCHARLMMKPENKIGMLSKTVVLFLFCFFWSLVLSPLPLVCLALIILVSSDGPVVGQCDRDVGWPHGQHHSAWEEEAVITGPAVPPTIRQQVWHMSLFFGHADGAVGQACILSNLAPPFLTLNLLCESPLIERLHFQYKPKQETLIHNGLGWPLWVRIKCTVLGNKGNMMDVRKNSHL